MWSMLAELAGQLAAVETRCFAAKAPIKCTQKALTVGHPLQKPEPEQTSSDSSEVDRPLESELGKLSSELNA